MIFKALNDPARRVLLDHLRLQNGQTLSELEPALDMSRFGVMKHLGVLEEAGLITTKKVGRFKYHYLNAVPLQDVMDRWIEPFLAAPAARSMINLRTQLEKEDTMLDTTQKPNFIHQTIIRCSQDALWDALMKPDQYAAHHFAVNTVTGGTGVGDALEGFREDGALMLREENTHLVPKTRIERSFEPHWFEGAVQKSHVVIIIAPEGDSCLLTLEHYSLPDDQPGIHEGWARFGASLKSWLETGIAIKVV